MNLLREKLRCQGHHLAQFGGGGGSSSSSSQTTNQYDQRMTVGNGGIAATGGSTVQVLDGGAITNSFQFADNAFNRAVDGIGAAGKNAADIVSKSNSDSLAFAKTQTSSVLDFATGADKRGFAAMTGALDFAGSADTRAFKFAADANSNATAQLQQTSNLVKDAYADAKGRGALTDKILIGAVAMAGIVAVMALKK